MRYLAWARETAVWLGATPQADDLFSSAIATPHTLIQQHLALDPLGLLHVSGKMNSSWGAPALIDFLATHYGVAPQQILVTAGGSAAFALIGRALVKRGDEVLLETPVYEPFVTVLTDQGATLRYIQRQAVNGFRLDLDALAQAVTPNTRWIVLSNLHNPSSAVLTPDDLIAIAEIAERVGARVIVDEIYRDLVPETTVCAAALRPDIFITVGSTTKSYGLGALRAGWIFAPDDLQVALRDAHVTYECSLSPYTQAITVRLFVEHYPAYRAHTDHILAVNRPVAQAAFETMQRDGLLEGEFPPQGCIGFFNVVAVSDTLALSAWLRQERHLLVAPGEFFGAAGYVRVAFGGKPDGLATALQRLADGLVAYRLAMPPTESR